MTAHVLSWIFLVAVLCYLALQLWLARRHIMHITAHRIAVPEEFHQHIALPAHQKAADYTCAKSRLDMLDEVIGALWLLILTLGGGIAWLYSSWSALLAESLWRDVLLIVSVIMASSVIGIPSTLYRIFVIEQRFGFNKMSFGLWLSDTVKQLLLGAVIGIPLLLLVLWLMAQMGTWWWLYVWLVWIVFQALLMAIYPTFIAPLFNKFTPLTDQIVKERIEQLLRKCGFAARGLFVMDGSKRSSHGNAYFAGWGRAKRIVFFDTLLQRLQPAEIEAVLAHELGHFKRRHIIKRMVWVAAVSLILLYLLAWLMGQHWFYAGLGVADHAPMPQHGLALLLFGVSAPVFTFLLTPLASLYSRRHEFEADRYAAEQASAADLIRALVKLYEDNAATLTPDPLHSVFYDSHPPAAVRIARLQALSAP